MNTTPDVVRILGVNCQQGRGLNQMLEWIADQAPAVDALLWHEAIVGDPDSGRRPDWDVIAEQLGMHAFPTLPNPGRNKVNVILLRQGGPLVYDDEYEHPRPYQFLAPANITAHLRGPGGELGRRAISLVSGHAPYQSAIGRYQEAEWLTGLFKHGVLGYAHHDWNCYRTSGHPAGSLHTVKDRPFAANRSHLTDDGIHVPDDRPDRHLRYAGLVDVGLHCANQLGIEGADGGTAGYGHEKRFQRGENVDPNLAVCIDRGYATRELAGALVAGGVIDTPELRKISDHLPVDAQLSYQALWELVQRSDEDAEYVVH